jgi:hypothetical protein
MLDKLKLLKDKQSEKKRRPTTQLTCLCIVLCELYLNKINELEDSE